MLRRSLVLDEEEIVPIVLHASVVWRFVAVVVVMIVARPIIVKFVTGSMATIRVEHVFLHNVIIVVMVTVAAISVVPVVPTVQLILLLKRITVHGQRMVLSIWH